MSDELKAHLLAAHRAVFDGLLAAVEGLDESGWTTPTGCPGWDVHDQLAHVVGVERAMLGDPPDEVELPDELPHVRNAFGRQVEVAVAARRGRPPAELVAEARETFERRVRHLAAMEASTLAEPMDGPGGMRFKASQMLRTRLFDMTCHEQDVRRAVGRPGDLDGPHADIAVEQVIRAWARNLPERLGADGVGVLGIEVAGRPRATIDLRDGTLRRGEEGPEPDATLALDAGQLLAIGTGRSDAPTIDELDVRGDRGLVERLLADASVTP
jgi:uncharacterized protein (TIGR03083 family)